MVAKVTMSVSKDKTDALAAIIKDMANMEVYVGIPEEKAARKESGEITNAQLVYIQTHGVRALPMRQEMQPNIEKEGKYSAAFQMYIHAHGSPLWHTPPRPIIEPAIEASQDPIAAELREAYKAMLDGKKDQALQHLKRAGMIGQNAVKAWFLDPRNNWAPNAPATVLEKLHKTAGGKGKKAKLARDIVNYYDDTGSFDGVTGMDGLTHPLIDTGEMRDAITYIVKDGQNA